MFTGITAPQLTPFNNDGSVNYDEYSKITNFICTSGINNIFVCGSTGEFDTLTIDEKQNLLIAAKSGGNQKTKYMFNVGALNLSDIKKLINIAKNENVNAISSTTPYYRNYDDEAIINYFSKLAKMAEGIPLYLYNIPGSTKNPISVYALEKLSNKYENIVGIKDSSMDFMTYLEYINANTPKNFDVVTGNDAQVLTSLQYGAKGAVVAFAGVFPKICVGIYNDYNSNNISEAMKKQNQIIKLRQVVRSVIPVTAHKKMLSLQGFNMGPAHFPMRDLSPQEDQFIKNALIELNLYNV